MSSTSLGSLVLRGVDHTARPTWKLRETITFYRDVLGLPLIHTISARGWGPATHPDFLHFFFDSGNGSAIAFFYYLGSSAPQELSGKLHSKPWPEDHVFDATHTAWQVDSEEELAAWRDRLVEKGVEVSVETRHEVIESIYFRDPNGYFVEITRKLRTLNDLDARDAALTLQAAMELEDQASGGVAGLGPIDDVWNRKAQLLLPEEPGQTAKVLVLNVPEFASLIEAAKKMPECKVDDGLPDYALIESRSAIEFNRKDLGVKPAVWYGLFTGGLQGRITVFDRDRVRIEP